MKKKAKRQTAQNLAKANLQRERIPLIEHLQELKRRLFYVAICVVAGAAVAYGFERTLIAVLLRPSHGQQFIYTSPLGGMNFLFGACLDIGLVVATPVIIYQLLAFLRPLMQGTTRRFLVLSAAAAGVVAAAGVAFGYFIGLPSALHFLLHQFTTIQVRPLITIQSYMSFVSLYLFGSALMFQLPLILLFINRIKPLKPSGLFRYERHLVVFAFLVAFIMNPTPNIIDQMLVVVPIIVMYQVGIALVWLVNRRKRPSAAVEHLRQLDAERQAARATTPLTPLLHMKPQLAPSSSAQTTEATSAAARPRTHPVVASTIPRRRYVPLRSQLIQ